MSSPWHPSLDASITFYSGLLLTTQIMVDAVVGGSLNNKTPKQSIELFEVMASNNYQRPSERAQKPRGVLEVDATVAILEQIQALSIQNAAIQKQLAIIGNTPFAEVMRCDFCQGNHHNGECTTSPFLKE